MLEMDQVPKILRPLVEQWSSDSLIVSFKARPSSHLSLTAQLETELSLLIPKARGALERYGHQVVIGNDLHRRKQEVVFVTPSHEDWVRLPPDAGDMEIEQLIVDRLVEMHSAHIAHGAPR